MTFCSQVPPSTGSCESKGYFVRVFYGMEHLAVKGKVLEKWSGEDIIKKIAVGS